jgi:DNA processing protein
MKINNISPNKHKYLQILENIDHPVKKLYYLGTLPDERRPTLAIVGSRKPSQYGIEVTERFARDLAARGVVIVSGLALGVDAIAHRAALDAHGTTLAVLANALPEISPHSNRALGERIIQEGGAIISEIEEGEPMGKWSFLYRNRIVSGLSDAILITEAGASSGTLNTASHALAQGKEVFVIPGNITSPLSAGCNNLLKQGAIPVTSPDDILEVIAPNLLKPQTMLALGSTPLETEVIKLLQSGVRDGDDIQQRLGTEPSELATTLTMLELSGTVRSLGANQWTLR